MKLTTFEIIDLITRILGGCDSTNFVRKSVLDWSCGHDYVRLAEVNDGFISVDITDYCRISSSRDDNWWIATSNANVKSARTIQDSKTTITSNGRVSKEVAFQCIEAIIKAIQIIEYKDETG